MNLVDLTGRNAAALVQAVDLGFKVAAGVLGGAGSAAIAAALIGTTVATSGILAAAALEDSATLHADEVGDDEGPNEGGAPSVPDGGVCGDNPLGPKTDVPTGDDNDVRPQGDTDLPERPHYERDPTHIPNGGDPRNPTIPKPPKMPYPIFE